VVSKLAQKSHDRVEKSAAFIEIRKKLAEAKANAGVVRLSEILKEQEQAKADGDTDGTGESPKGGGDLEKLSPQVEEAANILADLVSLQS
jgi:hypothetical protein